MPDWLRSFSSGKWLLITGVVVTTCGLAVVSATKDVSASGERFPIDPRELLSQLTTGDSGETVGEPEPAMSEKDGITARLANKYQPIVVVPRKDRFWPVSVKAALHMTNAGLVTCLETRRKRKECPPPAQLAHLSPNADPGDFLVYPVSPDKLNLAFDALISQFDPGKSFDDWVSDVKTDPYKTAQIYFFRSDRSPPGDPEAGTKLVNLQYWFFFPFNYQPIELRGRRLLSYLSPFRTVNYHEGDFEHISVLLRVRKVKRRSRPGKNARPRYRTDYTPRHVFMARHKDEGKWFEWNDEELERKGTHRTHPVVYTALGGHASYEACGPRERPIDIPKKKPKVRITLTESTVCMDPPDAASSGRRLNAFRFGVNTRLVELKPDSWACWSGQFGRVWRDGLFRGVWNWIKRAIGQGIAKDVIEALQKFTDGPNAPLRQFENQQKDRRVCLGR